MVLAQSIHKRWHSVAVAAAPQILTCAYCVLDKWEHENLSAPYWRWYCNDNPGACLIMKNKRIPIEPGRVILIPPHTVFATDCKGAVGHLYMHFTLGLDRTVTTGRIFNHGPSDAERAMIRQLICAIEKPPEENPLMASFLAQAVVNPALAAVPADYWGGRLPDKRMAQVLQRLRGGGPKVSNAALAREAGMNANAFIRKFRHATGHTPHQYRLRLRIEQGCGWLRMEALTMDQIAEAAGFCDRFHFSRVFKQVMGVSPAKFRDKMKPAAD
jgi:AraC-like DNA-binding protein